jgi:hypothetical protein
MTSLTNNTATVENAIDQVVSAIDDDTHGDSHVQTLLSAHRLFMDFHHDGTISAGKKHKKNKAALRSATKEAVALASYQSWIAGQHRIFLTACLEWLHFVVKAKVLKVKFQNLGENGAESHFKWEPQSGCFIPHQQLDINGDKMPWE